MGKQTGVYKFVFLYDCMCMYAFANSSYTANHILSIYKGHLYFITEYTLLKRISFMSILFKRDCCNF